MSNQCIVKLVCKDMQTDNMYVPAGETKVVEMYVGTMVTNNLGFGDMIIAKELVGSQYTAINLPLDFLRDKLCPEFLIDKIYQDFKQSLPQNIVDMKLVIFDASTGEEIKDLDNILDKDLQYNYTQYKYVVSLKDTVKLPDTFDMIKLEGNFAVADGHNIQISTPTVVTYVRMSDVSTLSQVDAENYKSKYTLVGLKNGDKFLTDAPLEKFGIGTK